MRQGKWNTPKKNSTNTGIGTRTNINKHLFMRELLIGCVYVGLIRVVIGRGKGDGWTDANDVVIRPRCLALVTKPRMEHHRIR